MHSYPWYFADWRSSPAVAAMTAEQRGVYRELLDYCWELGCLPADDRVLMTFARCTPREWSRCKDAVRDCFELRDGMYYSRKVEEKRTEIIEHKRRRAEANRRNGISGGRPKQTQSEPNGFPNQTQQESIGMSDGNPTKTPSPSPSPSPSPYKSSSSSSSPKPGEPTEPPDGQVFCNNLAQALLRHHAAAGFVGGHLGYLQLSLERLLATQPPETWADFERRMLGSLDLWIARWKADPAGSNANRVRLHAWVSGGDWMHPPAAVAVAAPVSKERALIERAMRGGGL